MGSGSSSNSSRTIAASSCSSVRSSHRISSVPSRRPDTSVTQSGYFTYHRPPRWYPHAPDQPAVKPMRPGGKRYQEVLWKVRLTSPELDVLSIERVMNRQLYTNYAMKHESLSVNAQRSMTIKMLFHGTSATAPQVVYSSQEGLDSRVGKGMWGTGTYFAVNSSYSVNYAYTRGDGAKQLLCCAVIVGDYVELPSDSTLVRPPGKHGSSGLYHSVKGRTGGSDVFVTYEPAMAYPFFVVTFR